MINSVLCLSFLIGFYPPSQIKPDKTLQERVNNLAKRMEIQAPVRAYVSDSVGPYVSDSVRAYVSDSVGEYVSDSLGEYISDSGSAQAFGGTLLSPTPAVVFGKFARINFAIAHELAHIKNNDRLTSFVVTSVVAIVTTAFFNRYVFPTTTFLPSPEADLLGGCLGMICLVAYSRFFEQRADLEACKYLTKEEKLEGIVAFENVKIDNLNYRNASGLSSLGKFMRKIQIDEMGNSRKDIVHPSLTQRIQKIRETI